MGKFSKLFKFLTLAFASSIIVPLTACNSDPVVQKITVTAFDTMLVDDAEVELYRGKKLVGNGRTDENGVAEITVPGYREYDIKVKHLEAGYKLDGEYKTSSTGEDITIDCTTSVATSAMPDDNEFVYQEGNIVYDFPFMDCNSDQEQTLSSLFEEKDLVILNFWFVNCQWCVVEFPIFEECYQEYKDRIEIVALNPYDTMTQISGFKSRMGLTFPMALDITFQSVYFNVTGYPTSVIIDKYGSIAAIESGAIQSAIDFKAFVDPYLEENYVPTLTDYEYIEGTEPGNNDNELGFAKPDVEMPASSEIEAAINGEGFTYSYYGETETSDAEYSWPWLVSEDGTYIYTSNVGVDNSFATIKTKFNINENQMLAFDIFCSTEDYDEFYVMVDGVIIHTLWGIMDDWDTLYAYSPLEEGEHELVLLYYKDYDIAGGEDIIKIKNMRFVDVNEVDSPTYIIRECYNEEKNTFVDAIYNEDDGYYHVGTANGPLVLADLNNPTQWQSIPLVTYAQNGDLRDVNGVDYTDLIIKYSAYASNSGINYTSVTQELKNALVAIASFASNMSNHSDEWLTMCNFHSAYGTNGKELADPIIGLAYFSAFDAQLGENSIYFNIPTLPRGRYSKFIPETSGVYKIESIPVTYGIPEIDSTLEHDVACWIYTPEQDPEVDQPLYESSKEARHFAMNEKDLDKLIMYAYLEANQTYYVACAYDVDMYRTGELKFSIEYVDESYDLLTACAPSYYTTEGVDASGMPTGDIISLAINVEIDDDGYYREKLSNGELGSYIYLDFEYEIPLFHETISSLIKKKGFNFSIDEEGNTVENGVDYTSVVESYFDKIITEEGETKGLVKVDETLGGILKQLTDRYSFECDGNWLKTCYYFNHLGA